eukprot:gene26526-biopygen16757
MNCHEELFATGIEADPREHPPRDMSPSETGHCYGGI